MVQFTVPTDDPVAHVHDCELVGYILEGEVITKLKNKPAQHLKKGDVFMNFQLRFTNRFKIRTARLTQRFYCITCLILERCFYKKLDETHRRLAPTSRKLTTPVRTRGIVEEHQLMREVFQSYRLLDNSYL